MNDKRTGEFAILAGAILWGIFPFITILSLATLAPLVSLGWIELCAALFFAALLTLRGKWKELTDTSALLDILLVTFFIGILYYVFIFTGLTQTSAGNASILGLTETLFAYLFFNLIRQEKFPPAHLAGAMLVSAGACVILYPTLLPSTEETF